MGLRYDCWPAPVRVPANSVLSPGGGVILVVQLVPYSVTQPGGVVSEPVGSLVEPPLFHGLASENAEECLFVLEAGDLVPVLA